MNDLEGKKIIPSSLTKIESIVTNQDITCCHKKNIDGFIQLIGSGPPSNILGEYSLVVPFLFFRQPNINYIVAIFQADLCSKPNTLKN